MTRILLDQGLPRGALSFLRAASWDVLHVVELGMSRATDSEIIRYAREDRRVLCTLDADFHALLAVSGHSAPSVVRVRQEGLKAQELADLLLAVWPRISTAVSDGAMVTITQQSIRIRRLPVGAHNNRPTA